jgi:hypothetical protein
MKVSIFSQRSVTDPSIVDKLFDTINYLENIKDEYKPVMFLTGGAHGAQQVIYNTLKDDYDFVVFKPWTQISKKMESIAIVDGKFDPTFFFYRNIQIVDNSDLVVIFDNGEKDAEVYKVKGLCEKKGKQMVVIHV